MHLSFVRLVARGFSRFRPVRSTACCLAALAALQVAPTSGTTLTVNGAQTQQTIDGFGVNLNSLSWKHGELRPALDLLVDELGATTWRVAFDMVDWEATNDNTDPTTPDWAYYNSLYSNAKFQNLWGTLHYLNQKGVTTNIMLSFMGRVPAWMGGVKIDRNMEDEYVEMIATVLFYARNTEKVQFDTVDPMTEVDWDGIEGPQVDSVQYTRLLNKLSVRLDSMGLGAVKFSGPNTANNSTGVTVYMRQMMSDRIVMNKVDHFAFHNYEGDTGNADSYIKRSAYPSKNFWITETSRPDDMFAMIGQNAASVLIWDAYDSVYNHAILANRGTTPPNDAGNGPALLAYNSSTGAYTRRAEFYKVQQMSRFVPRGSVRVGASTSGLTIHAFRHSPTGRVTLVGRNPGGSTIPVNGRLNGLPPVTVFQLYQTYGSSNCARAGDVVVTNGAFFFNAPPDSYFTLTVPGG